MIAFGPVPSRRLGRSLGINNIPPKACSYSCVYCQVGRTNRMREARRSFYAPDRVVEEVQQKVNAARDHGEPVDFLTFVPDGEPTLDANLGSTIRSLRSLGIPIAVITNGSLLGRATVRSDLAQADWVSIKVDTVSETLWHRVNRPHRHLRLEPILEGMRAYAAAFDGELATETMILAGLNDGEDELRATANFVGALSGATAYLAVPTRPPAEQWVRPPTAAAITRAYEVFRARHAHVELLLGYEGNAFASTGDPRADILGITSVHPMREAAMHRLIERAGAGWDLIIELIEQGQLLEVQYGANRYFLRPIGHRPSRSGHGDVPPATKSRASNVPGGALS